VKAGQTIRNVKLGLIRAEPRWQPRAARDTEHCDDILAAYASGAVLPALDVVALSGGTFALVDGYHRFEPLTILAKRDPKRWGVVDVRVVEIGDESAADWWSLAANRTHGLKRSPADKRRAVTLALAHPNAKTWEHTDIAAHLGVSITLIKEMRAELAQPAPRVVANEAAARAVATAVPGESVRDTAKRAGVSRSAVARAKVVAASVPSSRTAEGDSTSRPKWHDQRAELFRTGGTPRG
jgi:hypothetical protein